MRLLPALTLAGVIALILAVTLQPDPTMAGHLPWLCIFCGDHATADALANVILFIPLGAALAWVAPARPGPWRLGLFLSLAVELAQRFIAGRDASVGDVLTNTLGTLLGWAAWRYATRGAHKPAPALWPVAMLAFAGTVGATVWLFQPAPTDAAYYGMWTPVLGQFERYRGRVLTASFDSAPLPPRLLAEPAPVDAFVGGPGSLTVRFVAGPPTPSISPLVSVFDAERQEIMLLGPDRDDLRLRYRRHAAAWGLDGPDLRFPGATREWARGDTLTIAVERTTRGACLTAGQHHDCVIGPTPGRAWSLVLYPESFPEWTTATLDILWVAGLSLLLGWCTGTAATAAAAGVGALVTLLWLPALIGGVAAPAAELAGGAVGLVAGVWLRVLARRG